MGAEEDQLFAEEFGLQEYLEILRSAMNGSSHAIMGERKEEIDIQGDR